MTSGTRATTSSHGVGLAGSAETPKRSRASAAMSAGSPRRSNTVRMAASVSAAEWPGGGDVLGDLVQDLAPAVGEPLAQASRSVR